MKRLLAFFALLLMMQFTQAQDYKFGKVSKEELAEEFNPNDPDANATVLYRDQNIYFDYVQGEGFMQKNEIYERIKIYNKEGFGYATKIVRLYNESNSKEENISRIKAVTYNLENGKIIEDKLKSDGVFDEETNKYWKTRKFTMPNVKAGCIIEYVYTIESPFLGIDEVDFQQRIPIKKLDFKLSTPEYFNYKKNMNPKSSYFPKLIESKRNDKITLNSKTRSGVYVSKTNFESQDINYVSNIVSVKEDNIPALKEEPLVDNLNNYRAKIKFELNYIKYPNEPIESFATTWENVSKKIYESPDFGEELNKTSYFKDDLDVILNGVSDPNERIKLVYNFVKSKVKWNEFNGVYAELGVRKVYKEGLGNVADINLMLVAMLRYAGFDANPVLVSTKSNGIPLFPTREGFNYVIAIVETDSGYFLLDATDKFSVPNLLPTKLLNWQGRLIKKDGNSMWIPLNSKTPSKEIRLLNAELNIDDLSISGSIRNQFTDYQALNYREDYENFTDEEIMESLQEDYASLEVSNFVANNIDDLSKPVSQSYDFKINNAIEQIGDKLYVSPFLQFVPDENPFKSETRDYPIDFIYPIADKYMINLKMPEGYTDEALPENAKAIFGENDGDFTYLVKQNGQMLQFIMMFNLNKTLILPEEYSEFKQFFQMFVDKQSEKIVLKKV